MNRRVSTRTPCRFAIRAAPLLPLALVLIRPQHDLWEPAEHNGTFRGNNPAFVTATAALDHYWSGSGFGAEIRARGEQLRRRLLAMAARFEGEVIGVRGRRMVRGLHLRDPGCAARVAARTYREGLIIECSGPRDSGSRSTAEVLTQQELGRLVRPSSS